MGNALRKEIFNDLGYSSLKKRALDLLSQLKIDQALLNEQKTAEREARSTKKSFKLSKNDNNND